MEQRQSQKTVGEQGSALVYILIAIALLAVLTATFMGSSSDQTTSQKTINIAAELKSQINLIRSTIDECIITYPEGDSALVNTTNIPYPILPSSNYLADPVGSWEVSYIRCPGNPGNSNDHQKLFGGSSGKTLPPPPKPFWNWIYYNGIEGVFFATGTNRTDPYIMDALQRIDNEFDECEVDVVDARAATIAVSDVPGMECPMGYVCLRVWMIVPPGAFYPDGSSCP